MLLAGHSYNSKLEQLQEVLSVLFLLRPSQLQFSPVMLFHHRLSFLLEQVLLLLVSQQQEVPEPKQAKMLALALVPSDLALAKLLMLYWYYYSYYSMELL